MGRTKSGDAQRRHEQRQQEAAERQEAYDALSRPEKLARALTRGHEATREVLKLRAAR